MILPQRAAGGLVTFVPSQITFALATISSPICKANCTSLGSTYYTNIYLNCTCPSSQISNVGPSSCWASIKSDTCSPTCSYSCCLTTCSVGSAAGSTPFSVLSSSFTAPFKIASSAAGLNCTITFVVTSTTTNAYTGRGNEADYGRVFTSGGARFLADPLTGEQVARTVFTHCAVGSYPGTPTPVVTSSAVTVEGAQSYYYYGASPPPPSPGTQTNASESTTNYYANCVSCPKCVSGPLYLARSVMFACACF